VLARVKIIGAGHAVGSIEVSNADTSLRLGLRPNSLLKRTGIATRRICADDENGAILASKAVGAALADARLTSKNLGSETLLLYIQNGMTHLTPPGGILLARDAGIPKVRVISLDGVCAEPIHAIEIGALMLSQHRCDRVIVCASADFNSIVDDNDEETAGLFGAGAGAVVLQRAPTSETGAIEGLSWKTDASYWDLGTIEIIGQTRHAAGLSVDFGFYEMKGARLLRAGVGIIRQVVKQALDEAGWDIGSIDHIVSHQPNPKMLEIGMNKVGLPFDRVSVPGSTLGNMGPASVLIAFSILRQNGALTAGQRVLLLSFGLGFSCGCAALTI
jgi:3-oxoacyl-[acyl-carrier-protein] synthase-3